MSFSHGEARSLSYFCHFKFARESWKLSQQSQSILQFHIFQFLDSICLKIKLIPWWFGIQNVLSSGICDLPDSVERTLEQRVQRLQWSSGSFLILLAMLPFFVALTYRHAEEDEDQGYEAYAPKEDECSITMSCGEQARHGPGASEVVRPVQSHHDRHIQRSNPSWKDLRIYQVRRTEPTDWPRNSMNEDGHDRCRRCILDCRMTLDVGRTHSIGGTQVCTNKYQCDNLQAYSGHEWSPAANEVNDEEWKQHYGREFDNAVYSSCKKSRLSASDAELPMSVGVCTE